MTTVLTIAIGWVLASLVLAIGWVLVARYVRWRRAVAERRPSPDPPAKPPPAPSSRPARPPDEAPPLPRQRTRNGDA